MTNFSKIAHHFLGTGLTVSLHGKQYELLGIEPKGFLLSGGFASWGPETKPHFRSFHKLTQPIRVEGEEPFVPIERLYDLCMEEPFSRMPHTNQTFVNGLKERCYEIELDGGMGWFRYNEAKQFFSRYGAQDFVYNQFALFQQLLSWHFNLFSVPEGEFIEIEETTNTPEAGEK